MSRKCYPVLPHLFSCLAFLTLPCVFAEDGFAKLAELPTNPHEQRNLASSLLTTAFFYTSYRSLITRLFFEKKYGL